MTPDDCAHAATACSKAGYPILAAGWAQLSISQRAKYVLVNGRWCARKNILRKD